MTIKILLAGTAMILAPALAHAGLLGATVDVSARYPTDTSIFQDGGPVVVTNGVEYPTGSFFDYNRSWEVNVQDNQIIITDATSTGLPYQPATFNGWVLDVISGPAITSAHTDSSSTIVPDNVYISGGNLYINLQDVTATVGGSTLVDFTTGGVPEPTTWAMVLLGFAGLGFVGYRARRTTISIA
jgi:hypothetical protein